MLPSKTLNPAAVVLPRHTRRAYGLDTERNGSSLSGLVAKLDSDLSTIVPIRGLRIYTLQYE